MEIEETQRISDLYNRIKDLELQIQKNDAVVWKWLWDLQTKQEQKVRS